MRRLLPLVLLALIVLPTPALSTDLGEGNEAVAKTFAAWKARGPRLRPSKAKRRVMITGFGLFSGVDYNISGVVAASIADARFWPATTKLSALKTPPKSAIATGRLTEADGGAKAWQRRLVIDGETYEVGILLLDVLWDLGAAVTLFEAQTFKPHLIVMTGRGGAKAVFEAGALNEAARHPGFRSDGAIDKRNVPATPHVFDPKAAGVEPAIAMPWDNERLAALAREIIDPLERGYEVVAAPEARKGNTYICNNISCAVLHGLKHERLHLAGGKIKLEKIALPDTTAGFFHYPAAAKNDPVEVLAWARMLATVAKDHFDDTKKD